MSTQQTILAVVILLTTTPSCKQIPVQPESPPPVLIPLESGNRWEFQTIYWDTLDNPTIGDTTFLAVSAETTLYGHQWSLIWRFAAHQLFRNTHNGVVIRWLNHDDERDYLLYKYAGFVGDTYGYPVATFGPSYWIDDTSQQAIVIAVDTLVTVPAGSFNCIVYSYSSDHYWVQIHEYVSPTNGWVKTEYYNRHRLTREMRRTSSVELINLSKN
jgi:hypothetical protein